MRGRIAAVVVVLMFQLFQFTCISHAEDAEVLPKGIWSTTFKGYHFFPADERFNEDGDLEDVAVDYNTVLNGNVFPALSLVESLFRLPAGSANVGRSVVAFEYDISVLEFSLNYGLTDKLTIGLLIPYWWVRNDVDARLDTSKATVGKNARLNTIAPLGFPGTVPLTTQDAKDLLGAGLDINKDGQIDIQGFGYKNFDTWDQEGFTNIDIGFRYQYLKTRNWRLAFTGGIRLPTNEMGDDTDDLVDLGVGLDTWALLLRLNNDFTGIKNLLLNATFKYDLNLPDEETLRIPDSVDEPITMNRERVDRDFGDIFEFEFSGKYSFLKGVALSAAYLYTFKLEDDVSGDMGYNYASLEDETDMTSHIYILGLSYSTLPLYLEKKFPIPITGTFSYRNRFEGSNNALKSEYVSLALQVLF